MSGQVRSPNENAAWLSYYTCFMGHLRRRIRWWHSFFRFDPRKCQYKVKLDQIRSNFQNTFFPKAYLSRPVSSQDSKKYFYVRQLETSKIAFEKVTSPLPFYHCAQPKIKILLWNLLCVPFARSFTTHCSFFIASKFLELCQKADIFRCFGSKSKNIKMWDDCFVER